jgi:chromosome segregation ATPase
LSIVEVQLTFGLFKCTYFFRDVSKVAELICGVSVDSALANSPLETGEKASDRDAHSGSDLIWKSMYTMSSSRARPLPQELQFSNEKVLVLSHLLDCAVHVPDKQQRRTFIGRIMTLKKSTQKTIMAMIESRSSKHSPVKSATPTQKKASPHETSTKSSSRITKNSPVPASSTPFISQQDQKLTPPVRLFSSQIPLSTKRNAEAVISRMNCSGSSFVNSTVVEPSTMRISPVSNTLPGESTPPLKSSLRKSGDPSSVHQRGHSVAFGSPVANSLDEPFRLHSSFDKSPVPFLSPGTMESPNRMQSVVHTLQRQNEAQQQKLQQLQNQEIEMKKNIEQLEASHRQKMITMEAQCLERMQELARESEQKISTLQARLEKANELSSQGSVALRELKTVRDELEVLNHSKLALNETTEKLRKYKDKITELQDVKEALRIEQESHGKSIDEVIRLESELQQLQSVKRQVEEYRIRAIEAEVKLVECQDYLRRMERQCREQNTKNDHLYQDVIMQKEHMEELQRRIQEDTQRDSEVAIAGVGEGINELNPELKTEVFRLRNENLQLRAFQAKRTEDAVHHLEESLDDAKRLAERYKDEFLRIKEDLGVTQSALHKSNEREASLQDSVHKLQDRYGTLEKQYASIQEELELCRNELGENIEKLQKSELHNAQLREEVNEWMQKQQEANFVAEERLQSIQSLRHELSEADKSLFRTEENVKKLNHDADLMHATLSKNSEQIQMLQSSLEKMSSELEESRNKFSMKNEEAETLHDRNSAILKEINALEEKLRAERNQRKEEAHEAQMSLETTRQLLEVKNQRELEELQSNMARLLDDERKANRKKDEELKQKVSQLEQEWQQKYLELQDRSTSALQNSRQQAQDQVDYLKQENKNDIENLKKEWSEDVAKIRKQGEETLENFIRKGKEKVKVMQAKVHEEMQRLDDERRHIEEKYDGLERQSLEKESALDEQILSLKNQLEFVTKQMNDRMREADENLDVIKALDREKFKLTEENEQYRRQLGGRYGADGQIQSQLEKLQKEYKVIVEENRSLKKQIQNGNAVGTILESVDEAHDHSYRRGSGVDRRALTQLQRDFEERIDVLNNEKRDLIMKMSSQSTDVHKAEKRAWECEEEISRLKAENTSLKLRLERKEIPSGDAESPGAANENHSPIESSFHSARTMLSSSQTKPDSPGLPTARSSPSIDRAKKHKMEQETILRSRFSSITGTPPRVGAQNASGASEFPLSSALSQKQRHSSSFDAGSEIPARPSATRTTTPSSPRSPSKISKMASDVFRLGLTNGSPRSHFVTSKNAASNPTSMSTQHFPIVQVNEPLDENHQECNQS